MLKALFLLQVLSATRWFDVEQYVKLIWQCSGLILLLLKAQCGDGNVVVGILGPIASNSLLNGY